MAGPDAEAVGWVGYWESEWRGETVWECGWSVLPEAQGLRAIIRHANG